MIYTISYSEYMEYEETIEATTIEEAKRKFEDVVSNGGVVPVTARILEYQVDPIVI
jgi:hypothetical protein